MKLLLVNTLQCCCCGNTCQSWFTWTQSVWMTHLSHVEWPHVRWTPSRPADFCKTHSPHQRVHDPMTFNIPRDLDPKTRGASKLKEHYVLYFSTSVLPIHHLWPLPSPETDGSSQKCIISHGESISLLWTNWVLLPVSRNLRIIEHCGSSRWNLHADDKYCVFPTPAEKNPQRQTLLAVLQAEHLPLHGILKIKF